MIIKVFFLFSIIPNKPIKNTKLVTVNTKFIPIYGDSISKKRLSVQGFEPRTSGLKVQCSTFELHTLYYLLKNYSANNSKNTIINANKAIASVNANPRIAILNNSSFNEGFRAIPKTKAPKTVPIPTPVPASPIVARPAPMYLAACNSINLNVRFC